jgi:CheY-like chemotaxis protein
MDIQMPVMDGVAATKVIRDTLPEPARSVKIIAMTANVLQEDVQMYLDAGMDAYVSKPFQVNELLLKMDSVLGDAPIRRIVAPAPAQQPLARKTVEATQPIALQSMPAFQTAAPTEQIIKEKVVSQLPEFVTDRNFLKQFTGGNPEKMQKYITMFLENAGKLLASMDQALEAKDYQAIKIAAHSLKPQLSYMGVKEEISHIFLIEQAAGQSAHFDSLAERIITLNRVCKKAFEELKGLS